jgi:hypothetical protein
VGRGLGSISAKVPYQLLLFRHHDWVETWFQPLHASAFEFFFLSLSARRLLQQVA